jgi:hypothetical protein
MQYSQVGIFFGLEHFVWTILKVLHKLFKKKDCMQYPLMGI